MGISTAVDAAAVARVLGIKTTFRDTRGSRTPFLPQRIAVIGQGASAVTYPSDKQRVTSASQAASLYGNGSPVHLAVLQLLPVNGDGVGTIPVTVYPLVDDAAGVAASGDITPSGAQTTAATYRVVINNIKSEQFTIAVGASVADIVTAMTTAINAILEMPVIATDSATQVDLAAKWDGVSGNDIVVSIDGSTTAGTTFAITQPTGGLANPDVQPALDLIGDAWESLILNCLDIADTTALDAYSTFGESRWGALTHKPSVVFTGNTIAAVGAATAVSGARRTDRTNVQLVAPGSADLPLSVAARQLARIAVMASNNPPHDYGRLPATGLIPGTDGQQWLYVDRDLAVKSGSSTIEVKDGVINIADVVTFYRPTGDPLPAYRYVVDLIKMQNIIFNLSLIFASAEWDGAPLLPDDQPTANRSAKKPKAAVAAVAAMLDGLASNAIISDPEGAKASIVAEIDSQNPKRLNLVVTVKLGGNTNIKSIDLDFGFQFGTPSLVA